MIVPRRISPMAVLCLLGSACLHLTVGVGLRGTPIGKLPQAVIAVELHEQLPSGASQAPRPGSGPVLLANEASADRLKHGAEARFLHGLATEEFVEDNYVGTFHWQGDPIAIERDPQGRLWLHDPRHGFLRRLHRFNRFIYVYGPDDDHPEPIHGSVTFFSDGERVFQFLWQEQGAHAAFPRR